MIESKLIEGNSREVIKADRKWDAFFLLDTDTKIEEASEDLYPDIQAEALLTSYQDYYKILTDIPKGESLCDLGAGFGRGSFLAQHLNLPDCYSVELSTSRFKASLRACEKMGYQEKYFINKNVSELELKSFHHFYLYFPKSPVVFGLLNRMRENAKKQITYLYVTESHGDMIPFLEKLSFVSEVNKWKTALPRHSPFLFKFQITNSPSQNLLDKLVMNWGEEIYLGFRYHHLVLETEVEWIFSLSECDLHADAIEVTYFGRRISWDDVFIIEINDDEKQSLSGGYKLLRGNNAYFSEYRNGQVKKLS